MTIFPSRRDSPLLRNPIAINSILILQHTSVRPSRSRRTVCPLKDPCRQNQGQVPACRTCCICNLTRAVHMVHAEYFAGRSRGQIHAVDPRNAVAEQATLPRSRKHSLAPLPIRRAPPALTTPVSSKSSNRGDIR
jgi:hypothetical protein